MTLTKRSLVTRISDETGMVQQDVYAIVQKTLDYIVEALARGENVEFRNFGVFEVQQRKSRVGRNPNQPDHVVSIPSRKVVKFKTGKVMKDVITKGMPLPEKKPGQERGAEAKTIPFPDASAFY